MPKNDTKLRRPIRQVISNVYQALKINPNIEQRIRVLDKSDQDFHSRALKIGIWNIFKGNGGVQFFRDFQSIVKSCDVWAFQEVLVSPHSLNDFVPDGFVGTHGASYERKDGLYEGVMTLSKARKADGSLVKVFSKTEPLVKTPKVSLVTYVNVGYAVVRVVNVHQPLVRGAKRAGEDLDEVMKTLPDFSGPSIVAGDFNTFTRRYFEEVCDVMRAYGHTYIGVPNDNRSDLQKLDHVFQRGFMVERAEVIKEATSSDHFPLRINLILND